jgi:hypothetical protein
MSTGRHYDTVAFDVRENATMLFFARTSESGDIEDYILVMRAISDDFDAVILIEINETQLAGTDIIREASMSENMLTISFRGPVNELGGASELILTYDGTDENRASIEAGAFRVLGDKLSGGHA